MLVDFEGIEQKFSFRIPQSYTFNDLTVDVCRFWGVDPSMSTLRDEFNVMWPGGSKVKDQFLSAWARSKTKPVIRLVMQPRAKLPSLPSLRTEDANFEMALAKGAKKDSEGATRGGGKRGELLTYDMHEEIEAMIKKTRDKMRRRLAPAFHQPKFVIDAQGDGSDTFRSLDPKTLGGGAKVAKNTTHFFNMLCYAGFLITVIIALLVRINIQAASDVQAAVSEALLCKHYKSGQAEPHAPRALALFCNDDSVSGPRTIADFWAWVEGPFSDELFMKSMYHGKDDSIARVGFLREHNLVMGGVMLNQHRLSRSDCTLSEWFTQRIAAPLNSTDVYCFRPFSVQVRVVERERKDTKENLRSLGERKRS